MKNVLLEEKVPPEKEQKKNNILEDGIRHKFEGGREVKPRTGRG